MTDAAAPGSRTGAAPARSTGAARDAFVTLDRGTATSAAAIVARVDRRWRLLAAAAVPTIGAPASGAPGIDLLGALLGERIRDADPALADALRLGAPGTLPPALEAFGTPAAEAVVLAATEATRLRLEADANAAGWRATGVERRARRPARDDASCDPPQRRNPDRRDG